MKGIRKPELIAYFIAYNDGLNHMVTYGSVSSNQIMNTFRDNLEQFLLSDYETEEAAKSALIARVADFGIALDNDLKVIE